MCGIAGIWRYSNSKVSSREIKSMTDTIAHRGPDGEGLWLSADEHIALGHRRLSIIDLSDNAAQPMLLEERYIITFNGEIYNYIELRDVLKQKGAKFRTESDTEVLLYAYRFWGENCLKKLDGMFAFVIYDQLEKKLFCARDRFGEKPFYYYQDNGQFVFASEMKAIFAAGIEKEVNSKMLYNYLKYDIIENPHDKSETFYKNIKQLPASSCLTIDSTGEKTIKKYWDIDANHRIQLSENDAIDQFKNLFFESVKRRMRSDVAVGSSLSGGVDSSSVLAAIRANFPDSNLNTFTARFNDKDYDEGHYVELLRKEIDFENFYCYPSSTQILDDLDKIFYHQEEPFGSTSIIAQWEVMKLAKEKNTTVLLDGQGADEVIAGYFKYFLPYLHEIHKKKKSIFKRELSAIENHLGMEKYLNASFYYRSSHPKLYNYIAATTRDLRIQRQSHPFHSDFSDQYRKEPIPFDYAMDLNTSLYYDCFSYGLGKLLRFSDRNAMAHSREVRLPYLSHELVEFVFSLPTELKIQNGWTKYILRSSMKGHVPSEILFRKDKKGFQAPASWLKDKKVEELKMECYSNLRKKGILDSEKGIDSWQIIMGSKLYES